MMQMEDLGMKRDSKALFDPHEWEMIQYIKSELRKLRRDGLLTDDKEIQNLVFEGGGVKGIAYVGALQVLQELGLLIDANNKTKIKCVAGASAGAMLAALVAAGLSIDTIEQLLNQDIRGVLEDHSCGCLSLIPNLITTFGWNPGRRIERWFQQRFAENNLAGNITFEQLFKKKGMQLCIVATNLNRLDVEYFHPKTTPNVEIHKAVRMSMSLPFYFKRIRYPRQDFDPEDHMHEKSCKCIRCMCCCCVCGRWEKGSTRNDVYVDGGLICNYPIHVFDGWWLSINKKDHYIKKLRPFNTRIDEMYDDEARFGKKPNWNTIGMLLYAANEGEIFVKKLLDREANLFYTCKSNIIQKCTGDNTAVKKAEDTAKSFINYHVNVSTGLSIQKNRKVIETTKVNRQQVLEVFENFMQELDVHARERADDTYYPRDEVYRIIDKCSQKQLKLLCHNKPQEFKKRINPDGNEEVNLDEILTYFRSLGINLRTGYLGLDRVNITKPSEYITCLMDAVMLNTKKRFVKGDDIQRTIGINTLYVGTTDWRMEQEDRDLLKKSGRRGVIAFFIHSYIPRLRKTGKVPSMATAV